MSQNITNESEDLLYNQAVAIVLEFRRPSISLLQRKLGISYARASSFIKRMEDGGMISKVGESTQDVKDSDVPKSSLKASNLAIKNSENQISLGAHEITVDALKNILIGVNYQPSLDDDQTLYVSSEHIEFGTFISLDNNKNLLQFHTYSGVKPGVSQADMYSFINLLNSSIARPQFFATGSDEEGFYLYGRYFLSTQFGIDSKAFVTALDKFAGAFMAGMRQDKDDIFFD